VTLSTPHSYPGSRPFLVYYSPRTVCTAKLKFTYSYTKIEHVNLTTSSLGRIPVGK